MLYIFVVNHSEDNMFRIGFDGCNLRFQILPSGKVMSVSQMVRVLVEFFPSAT